GRGAETDFEDHCRWHRAAAEAASRSCGVIGRKSFLRRYFEGLQPIRLEFQENVFFAPSGTSTFVSPTSLISTVVVRSTSTSLPLQSALPFTLNPHSQR